MDPWIEQSALKCINVHCIPLMIFFSDSNWLKFNCNPACYYWDNVRHHFIPSNTRLSDSLVANWSLSIYHYHFDSRRNYGHQCMESVHQIVLYQRLWWHVLELSRMDFRLKALQPVRHIESHPLHWGQQVPGFWMRVAWETSVERPTLCPSTNGTSDQEERIYPNSLILFLDQQRKFGERIFCAAHDLKNQWQERSRLVAGTG